MVGDGVEPENAHDPRRRSAVTLETLHRRRLAGAVGTEDAQHLTAPRGERDAVHRGTGTVANDEVVASDDGHGRCGAPVRRRKAIGPHTTATLLSADK